MRYEEKSLKIKDKQKMNIAYNMDCMEYLKTVPDKYFDLAVVDPPYGGGAKESYGAEIAGGGDRL